MFIMLIDIEGSYKYSNKNIVGNIAHKNNNLKSIAKCYIIRHCQYVGVKFIAAAFSSLYT